MLTRPGISILERCAAPTEYILNEDSPRIEIQQKALGWKVKMTGPVIPRELKGYWLKEHLLRHRVADYLVKGNRKPLDEQVHGRATGPAPTTDKEVKEQEEFRKARERSLARRKKVLLKTREGKEDAKKRREEDQ